MPSALEFDDKLIDKYLKLKAMAEGGATEQERAAFQSKIASMEEKYPGLDAIAAAAQKLKEADAADDPSLYHGVDIDSIELPENASAFERFMFEQMKKAVKWAQKTLDEEFANADDSLDDNDEENDDAPYQRRSRKERRRMKLEERIEEEVELHEVGESEEGGVTFYDIDFSIPVDLWSKVRKSKSGPKKLLDFFQAAIDELDD